jgi:hypothetical protein
VQARSILRSVIDGGKGNLADVNNYSWFALFLDNVSPDDVAGLVRAVTRGEILAGHWSKATLALMH